MAIVWIMENLKEIIYNIGKLSLNNCLILLLVSTIILLWGIKKKKI